MNGFKSIFQLNKNLSRNKRIFSYSSQHRPKIEEPKISGNELPKMGLFKNKPLQCSPSRFNGSRVLQKQIASMKKMDLDQKQEKIGLEKYFGPLKLMCLQTMSALSDTKQNVQQNQLLPSLEKKVVDQQNPILDPYNRIGVNQMKFNSYIHRFNIGECKKYLSEDAEIAVPLNEVDYECADKGKGGDCKPPCPKPNPCPQIDPCLDKDPCKPVPCKKEEEKDDCKKQSPPSGKKEEPKKPPTPPKKNSPPPKKDSPPAGKK